MPESTIHNPVTPCLSPAQRRALFASANQRGLSIDDLRALTPHRSVSRLTAEEARALLARLHGDQRRFGAEFRQSRRRKPRRPSNVIALISADQLDLIRKLRIAMGWTQHQLGDHMKSRHYPSDPARTMDLMQTSRDGSAVIEHLKKILRRTLESGQDAAVQGGTGVPPVAVDPRRRRTLPQLMQSTPPFPRLMQLLQLRRKELEELTGLGVISTHPDNCDCCAGVAHAIYELESQITNLKSKEPA